MWKLWNKLPRCYTYKECSQVGQVYCNRVYYIWAFRRKWEIFKEKINRCEL